MSSLRNILQRCASRNSIPGGTPFQIQCTFNPVYSAYPTSISRQAYSSDANEAPENGIDPVQKYFLELIAAKKLRSNVKEQNASKTPTFNKNQKSPPNIVPEDKKEPKSPTFNLNSIKSQPNVAKDQKASNSPTFNKNLNLRMYYINIRGFSKKTTPESLREFYSQFGEIAYCNIIFPGNTNQFGSVAFTSQRSMKGCAARDPVAEKSPVVYLQLASCPPLCWPVVRPWMDRALNSLPHCIDGKEIYNVRPGSLGRKQLTLKIVDLSPKTTTESLGKFYSRFGMLDNCWIYRKITADVGEVTFRYQKDMHRALDAQPHVIDESEVFLQYATYDLDLLIQDILEDITEEELIVFYSKYGQLRQCQLIKRKTGQSYAYVSYSAIDEVNRALDDRPHIIGRKPLQIEFLGRGHIVPVSLFVGSLPENVTEETLREEFSKYGKPVYWELKNDGRFNQSGPYGIVTYSSEQEALNALNSGPHTIEGAIVDVRKAKEAGKSVSKEKS
ncbi:RNA recognition motif domain-containing protein [Ditylenchus destructor]|nr:RNA recognition motif domain-containing protein [Ditylenchus destructor]